jgi:hypothetical protein
MFQYPFQHRNHERIGPTSNKSLDIGLKATSHELGAKYFVPPKMVKKIPTMIRKPARAMELGSFEMGIGLMRIKWSIE